LKEAARDGGKQGGVEHRMARGHDTQGGHFRSPVRTTQAAVLQPQLRPLRDSLPRVTAVWRYWGSMPACLMISAQVGRSFLTNAANSSGVMMGISAPA